MQVADLDAVLSRVDRVAVAVSGGSDSLALMMLVGEWCAENDVEKEVLVLTVDHGLRAESASEATFVAQCAEQLGFQHQTLIWHEEKPGNGLSAAAREARYELIHAACVEVSISDVLVAHTFDDQAETVAMRLVRGGGNGVSGMGSVTYLVCHEAERVVLHRPLMQVTRQELRDYLSSKDTQWIDDPSNENPAYERVRVRYELMGRSDQKEALVDFASLAGRWRANLAKDAALFIDKNVTVSKLGLVSLDLVPFTELPPQVALYVLQTLLACVGGRLFLPASVQIQKQFEPLLRGDGRVALARCVVEKRGTKLRLYREMRDLPSLVIPPHGEAIWDDRFLVKNETTDDLTLVALGEDLARIVLRGQGDDPTLAEVRAFASCPAIFEEDALSSPVQAERYWIAPFERFCGAWDMPVYDVLSEKFTIFRNCN